MNPCTRVGTPPRQDCSHTSVLRPRDIQGWGCRANHRRHNSRGYGRFARSRPFCTFLRHELVPASRPASELRRWRKLAARASLDASSAWRRWRLPSSSASICSRACSLCGPKSVARFLFKRFATTGWKSGARPPAAGQLDVAPRLRTAGVPPRSQPPVQPLGWLQRGRGR